MIESVIEFFTTKENVREIIFIGIAFFLGVVFTGCIKFFKWLGNILWVGFKTTLTKSKNKIKKVKVERQYKRTIKQIERKEIPIPNNFLLGKSPEKNPELKRIFQMMDNGLIEVPDSYKIQKLLKDRPDIIKGNPLDIVKLPVIKPPTLKK